MSKSRKRYYNEHPELKDKISNDLNRGRETRWGAYREENMERFALLGNEIANRGSRPLTQIAKDFKVSLDTAYAINAGTHWSCHK